MSYMALYRKWRPKSFDDVKGQDHIVQTLRNQIKANRIGHAYLLCGTRGTGKTTVAKIYAKAVNCLNPQDGNPCNECEMCVGINDQTLLNVIEIDAASNNGVENIRQIRDEVQYSPTEGKYKVYIIDEVHMLSMGAFNALLKTLEEPPEYVIFILATTEAHKLPITILSRCQRYDFKRITVETISERLQELMNKENVNVQDKAIRYIAKAADGALRDALSIIDQCISFHIGEELTLDKVLEIVGAVDIEVFREFLDDILQQNVNGCIARLEELILKGKEINQLVIDFTWYLRNLMIAKTAEKPEDLLDLTDEKIQLLTDQANHIDHEKLMFYIQVFSELSSQLKYSTQKRVLLEIALIKLCRPEMESNNEAILARMSFIEDKIEKGIKVTSLSHQAAESQGNEIDKEELEKRRKERAKALPEEISKVGQNWTKIISQLGSPTQNYLKSAKPIYDSGNTIVITVFEEIAYLWLGRENIIQEIVEQIHTVIDGEVTILVRQHDNMKKPTIESELGDLQKLVKHVNIDYK